MTARNAKTTAPAADKPAPNRPSLAERAQTLALLREYPRYRQAVMDAMVASPRVPHVTTGPEARERVERAQAATAEALAIYVDGLTART